MGAVAGDGPSGVEYDAVREPLDERKQALAEHWRATVRYIIILACCWFVVGLLFPILIVEQLDRIRLGGLPLGFWFAMQGSTISFTVLLFVYCRLMNTLDKKHDVEDR